VKEEARASKGRQAFRCERLYSVSRVIRAPKTMASNINTLAVKFLLASGESCSGESRKKEVIFWRGLRSLERTAKRLFVFPSIFCSCMGHPCMRRPWCTLFLLNVLTFGLKKEKK